MTPRFRVAVIGAGIGAAHVEGYRDNAAGYEVAVICDLDAARAAGVAASVPGAVVETSYDAVLARGDIDLVDICLPPYLHLDTIAAALAAGKHVLCEKPLVGSLVDVEQAMRAAEKAGRAVVPVYQYRYGNGLARLRRLIAAGVTGRPLVASIETHWNRPPEYYDVRWRGRKATELGGAMLGHAIHAHDLLTFTLGPVRRVFAKVATMVNPVETEDCAAVCLEMASGALVTSSVTLGAAEELSKLRFCFSGLTAENPGVPPYRPAEGDWRFVARGARTQGDIEAALAGFVPRQESFSGLIEALHPALAGTAPWPLTLQDAYNSLELVSAIYYSTATNTAVELPLAPDHPVRAGWAKWLP
jgi:predicted dehydrogenase